MGSSDTLTQLLAFLLTLFGIGLNAPAQPEPAEFGEFLLVDSAMLGVPIEVPAGWQLDTLQTDVESYYAYANDIASGQISAPVMSIFRYGADTLPFPADLAPGESVASALRDRLNAALAEAGFNLEAETEVYGTWQGARAEVGFADYLWIIHLMPYEDGWVALSFLAPYQSDPIMWEGMYFSDLLVELDGGLRQGAPDQFILATQGGRYDSRLLLFDPYLGDKRMVDETPRFYYHMAWSPDGRQFAVLYEVSLNESAARGGELVLYNADGSNRRVLVKAVRRTIWMAWSPDSTRLAYSTYGDNNRFIYSISAAGGEAQQLTTTGLDEAPSWSPDGRQIAFLSARDGNWEVYVMNADGSNPRNLTNSPAHDHPYDDDGGLNSISTEGPVWSPDGRQIAFMAAFDIYAVNSDGTNLRNLTQSADIEVWPAWSPNGIDLAYFMLVGDAEDNIRVDITVYNTASGAARRLLPEPVFPFRSLRWLAESRLLFAAALCEGDCANPDNVFESGIYVIKSDGSDLRLIVDATPQLFEQLLWQP